MYIIEAGNPQSYSP